MLVNSILWSEPDSSTRNVIAPTVDVEALTLDPTLKPSNVTEQLLIRTTELDEFGVPTPGVRVNQRGQLNVGFTGRGTGNALQISPWKNSPAGSLERTNRLLRLDAGLYIPDAAHTFTFLDVGGTLQTPGNAAIHGLVFNPSVQLTGGSLATHSAVKAGGVFSSTGLTLTDWQAYEADTPLIVFTPVITNRYGFRARNQGRAEVTNAYGVYVESQVTSSGLFGVYNASSWHHARFDAKSANYTMTSNDWGIRGTGGAGGITITLPSALRIGHEVFIAKVDSGAGAVTVSRAGADTIEGATSLTLAAQYDSVMLAADGSTDWKRLDL